MYGETIEDETIEYIAKVVKRANSHCIPLPSYIMKMNGLRIGDTVKVTLMKKEDVE